jgi:hypothetical protein
MKRCGRRKPDDTKLRILINKYYRYFCGLQFNFKNTQTLTGTLALLQPHNHLNITAFVNNILSFATKL